MLADILTFQERNASGAGHIVDADTLRNTLDMLHKDDRALERYFGLGKDDLLKWFENTDKQSAPDMPHPTVLELARKIRLIESFTETGCSDELHETFSGFYRPLVSYFESVFMCDDRYEGACAYFDVETLLSSVRPYVVNSIKRLSEKSLVHFLNTRIAEGVESDLQSFEQYLCTESSGTFLESYPVLADLLFRQLEGTAAYLYKIILHFTDDIDELARVFGLPDRRIHSLELGLGDPHADGETVCAVRVGSLSLVYKPRSNREAQLYGSLLRLFYELTADEVFSVHAPLLVCRDDHCWIEKIDNRACDTAADIELFYRRTGAQIALVHALNGIDFHYETSLRAAAVRYLSILSACSRLR
jgi:lantibiotic modifying enzyme